MFVALASDRTVKGGKVPFARTWVMITFWPMPGGKGCRWGRDDLFVTNKNVRNREAATYLEISLPIRDSMEHNMSLNISQISNLSILCSSSMLDEGCGPFVLGCSMLPFPVGVVSRILIVRASIAPSRGTIL